MRLITSFLLLTPFILALIGLLVWAVWAIDTGRIAP